MSTKYGKWLGGKPSIPHKYTNPYPNPDIMATGMAPTQTFPNSVYTTAVPASPVISPNSATLVSNFIYQYQTYYHTVGVNTGSYTPTRYVVHGNTFAWQPVKVNPGNRWSGSPQGTIMAPIPPNAVPDNNGTDRQMTIWNLDPDPITGKPMVWEFWVTDVLNGWQTNTIVRGPTDGSWNGVYPWSGETSSLMTSAAASHLSYLGGMITVADVLSGTINHSINLSCIYTGSFVAPATQYDGSNTSNSVPEGTRFYFPSSVVMPSGLSPIGQMIFQAIKTYGAYILDTSGAVVGYSENSQSWNNYNGSYPLDPYFGSVPQYNTMTNFPWSQMVAITPMSGSAIVLGEVVPSAPVLTASSGSVNSGQVTLTWTAPASSGSSSIAGYSVYYGTTANGQLPTVQASTNSSTLTYVFTLTSGNTYYFKVAATSSTGTGRSSNEISVTAP